MWTIALRAARPALVAGAVLALARALGEAIMLAMVSGGVIFAPNPIDGPTFVFEPVLPLAAAIVQGAEGITVKPYGATLFAIAAVIMVSSVVPVDHGLGRAPAPAALRSAGMTCAPTPPARARSWPLRRPAAARRCAGRPASR